MNEAKPIPEHDNTKVNFSKMTPEEQREYSKKNMPDNNDAPSENELLGRENAKKFEEENSRHIV